MQDLRSRAVEIAYALARIVFGFLFACHGAQKLFGLLGGQTADTNLKMAEGIIEFFGGVLIGLGLITTVAAFIACGEMAVAYFKVHAPKGFFPIQNRGEAAVMFCFFFLVVIFRGGGPYSLDGLFRWHRRTG